MKDAQKLLVSMNFEASKGGIARVARLLEYAINFDCIFSYFGNAKEEKVTYCNKNPLLLLFLIMRRLLSGNIGLIIFDHVGPASLVGFVPKILIKKIKIAVFLHDEEAWSRVSSKHKLGLNKATHILCNSNYTYQKFVISNPEYKRKTHVCLLGGVPEAFCNNKELADWPYKAWALANVPYLLFVSRLWKEHRYKGYLELIEAFALHLKNNPEASTRLAIVGNGNDVEFIKETILIKRLSKHIQVFTGVTDETLIEFYRNTTALIFPSTREGFGFVFLEAMYFSKPCIGIKRQPAEEIFVDGESGILLNNNHPVTLLQCLSDLEHHPQKFAEIGRNGHKVLQKKFLNQHFKERLLDILNIPE